MNRSLLALLALLAACGRSAAPPPSAAPSTAPMSAPTPFVRTRPPEGLALLELPAHVIAAPESYAAIAPPLRARIVALRVQLGQRVRKGDVVAEVVMPELLQAAAQLVGAEGRAAAWGRRKAQLESLKSEGLARLADLAEAETQLAQATAERQSAQAVVRAAGFDASSAKALLEGQGTVPLKSPIAGVVSEVRGALGETRDPSGEPLVRVQGEGALRVEARLVSAFPAEVQFSFLPRTGAPREARFVSAAPQVDSRDGTFAAWFQLAPGEPLPVGLPGVVRVRFTSAQDVVAVPASAVALEGARAFVLVRRKDALVHVPVEVLLSGGGLSVVRGQLQANEEVAQDAALALQGSAENTGEGETP